MKVNTDGVLLGASVVLTGDERHILDIGTGTGVIALMMAQRSPEALVEGVEIDPSSAEEARLNFASSIWKDRLFVRNVDLNRFNPDVRYDLVVSNPPYFDGSLKNPDDRVSEARHCVSLSYGDIFSFCAVNLTDDGKVALVLPSDEEVRLRRVAGSFGFFISRIVRVRTSPHKNVSRIIVEFNRGSRMPVEEELVIRDGAGYSKAYSELTGDFYLPKEEQR